MSETLPAPRIPVKKLEAATRQLNTAIRMFFDGGDAIAIHTLAAAAEGVLSDVAHTRGLPRLFDLIRDEYRGEFLRAVNAAQNFFKHADRDHDAVLDFAPEQTEFTIFAAVYYCILLGARLSDEQVAFGTWFVVDKPSVLIWDRVPQELREVRNIFDDRLDPMDPLNLVPFREYLRQKRTR